MPDEVTERRQLTVLTSTYPAWWITYDRGDGHTTWRARRHTPLTEEQKAAGLVESITADSAAALVVVLGRQAMLVHLGLAR